MNDILPFVDGAKHFGNAFRGIFGTQSNHADRRASIKDYGEDSVVVY